MPHARARAPALVALAVIFGLATLAFVLQAVWVRPWLWPAGTGLALSGDAVPASLGRTLAVPRTRPPHLADAVGRPIVIEAVAPGSPASREGLGAGAAVTIVIPGSDGAERFARYGADALGVLDLWRRLYARGPRAPLGIEGAQDRRIELVPAAVWEADAARRGAWLRQHLGPLLQMAAFLAGALALVALGARGMTARLMTLALVGTAVANGGPLYGAELALPVVGAPLLVFSWLVTPLVFPVIGLAVLYFPSRAPLLDRHRWIYAVLPAAAAPMLVMSLLAIAFLLGVDAVAVPLGWMAAYGWMYDASFGLALAVNVAIVIEGINRFRGISDANERRRIQIVVYTGVPAVFAFALKAGVPLAGSLAGRTIVLPALLEGALQLLLLLPAVALPYAVAVKRVFSPRTVLRSGLQYALARRTLSVLVVLPLAVLVFSLFSERNRPLMEIVLERPWFYAVSLGLAAAGFRFREQAQRRLDRRFFRAEYDAREILVSLANRVPFEQDPSALLSMVVGEIDDALHPESIAVLAGEQAALDVIATRRAAVDPLSRESGLATLLRWSADPLEVFLDDERSPASRLPSADRAWLGAGRISLLVPILAGTGDDRMLVGLIALGQKRSEEPYSAEDRRLLSGIAAQMSVALDLSRLRRRASESAAAAARVSPAPGAALVAGAPADGWAALALCPACRRCFDVDAIRTSASPPECPDDGAPLQPEIGMVPVIDGKYRVDALIGRGGMGAVYRARDLRLTRDVAVKVLRAELIAEREARDRFEREAQIIARLQHPAIVTIFDYGHLPYGTAFLVMEFVPGVDLRQLLERERVLSLDRTVTLMTAVAGGVDAAHQAGVLHRDLKPENILLPATGAGPKVLDFGVAKTTHQGTGADGTTHTAGATIIGTPSYMAPEQLRGEAVDGRADVYSLAVMTFEALTGRLPFGVGSFVEIGIRQAEAWARLDYGHLPAAVAAVLGRGLALDRDRRPPSAGAFAEELRRARTG